MSVVYNDLIKPVAGKVFVKQISADSICITTEKFSDNIGITKYLVFVDGEKNPIEVYANEYGQLNFDYTRANLAGKLNVSVAACDEFGNKSKAAKASITIKDVTRPEEVTGLDVKPGANQKNATLTWNKGIDNVGVVSYEIYIDGKKYTSKNNYLTVKGLSAGSHEFTVIAVDKAKNSSVVSSGYEFEVEDITAPKNGKVFVKQTSADSISITTGNFSDNVGITKYLVYIDGKNSPIEVYANEYGQLNFDYTRANLAGKLNVSVAACDESGNKSKAAKASITIKDVTRPEEVTGLDVKPGANQKNATLTWNKGIDNVGVVSYEIYVDGKKYTSKTNSLTVKGLSAGSHEFTVIAVDKAKNSSVVSSGYEFEVEDITAPKNGKVFVKQISEDSISITTGNFSDNVGITKYLVYIDGEKNPIEVYADEHGQLNYLYTRANLAGKLNVSVAACDESGNKSNAVRSSITIQSTVIKDFVKPEKVTGLTFNISDDSQTVTLSWNKGVDNAGVVSYEIYVDGKKYTSQTNSLSVNGLDFGKHSFYVCAIDQAKNKSEASSNCSFEISDSYTDQYGNNIINITKGYAVKVRDWDAFEKDFVKKGSTYSKALQNSITGSDGNEIINFPKEKFVYVEGNISLGKGDDVINLIGDSSRDNYTELQMGGNIDLGDGNNVFNIQYARFDCGVYVNNDENIFDESSNYTIKFGSGDDKFNITDAHEVEWGNNISFGAGNDSLTIDSTRRVTVDNSYKSTVIDFGAGNDKLTLIGDGVLEIGNSNSAGARLLFGDGNDTLDIQEGSSLALLGYNVDNIDLDFGAGVDTLNIDGCLIVGYSPNALTELSNAEVITGNGYLIAPDWVLADCSDDVLGKFEDAGINVRSCGDYQLHIDFDINMYNNDVKANAQEATDFYEWGDGDIDVYLMGDAWSDADSKRLQSNTVDWYKFTIGDSETDEAIWNTGSFEFEYNNDSEGEGEVIVEIQNSVGKTVKRLELEYGDEKTYKLSALAAGEYFMKISLEDENSDVCARLSVSYEF